MDFHDDNRSQKYRSTIINKLYNTSNSMNKKRIMCHHILMYGMCKFNNNCKYAHSYNEQILDNSRKKAYDVIKSSDTLKNVDLIADNELYTSLQQLTKTCSGCNNYKCVGGVNCINGAISIEYTVCLNDLNMGKCYNTNCKKRHLTQYGLIPYCEQYDASRKLNNNMLYISNKNQIEDDDYPYNMADDNLLRDDTNAEKEYILSLFH